MKKTVKLSGFQQKNFFRAGILVIIASAFGLSYNGIRTDGLPFLHKEFEPVADSHLNAEEAYLLYRRGNILFIDTRYEDEYRAGHIPSAVNLPSRATVDEMMTFLETLDKNESFVVYCGNIQCNSARRLAGFMQQYGFTRIYVFSDGYESWIQNHLPVKNTDRK